jgi:hypothetical protein
MKKIIANFKTSIFGAVAGLPMIVEGIGEKDLSKIAIGVGTLLIGLFAKDNDVKND